MIACDTCGTSAPTNRARGGPSGLPSGWVSIVAVSCDDSTQFDSVNDTLSGVYCSTDCSIAGRSHSSFLEAARINAPVGIKREAVESREMQATRIGLTILDILDALFLSEQSEVGALIPLMKSHEELPESCLLAVHMIDEENLPPEFQMTERDDESL